MRSPVSGDLFVCTVAPKHGRQIPPQIPALAWRENDGVHEAA